MSTYLARLWIAVAILLMMAGCQSPQQKLESKLGAPPDVFIFFEDTRYHVLSLEAQQLARYQVLDEEDKSLIDLIEGEWSKKGDQLTLVFDGAESQHEWQLKAMESGYELMNAEVIEREQDVQVQFRKISDYAVALRFYEWQLSHVEADNLAEAVKTPGLYSFKVKDDVSYLFRADCKHGIGHYQMKNNILTLMPGLMTQKKCPANVFSNQFVQWLSAEHEIKWGDSYQQLILVSGRTRLTFTAANALSLR